MKLAYGIFALCIAILALAFVIAYNEVAPNRVIKYNCDMAEFHPDYPPEVRQKCRELRNENRSMQ